MADLLATNREQSARIRVENIIATDITVELMEILELYAELLMARAGMLDLRDKLLKESKAASGGRGGGKGEDAAGGGGLEGEGSTGLEEAAASLVYAAPRLPREIKELALVRSLLVERFGKEWGAKVNENEDGIVPKRVSEKLRMEVPREGLVQAYLEEIARSYGVDWPRRDAELEEARDEVAGEEDEDDEDDDDGEGGTKEQPILADGAAKPATPSKGPGKVDLSGLNTVSATPPKGLGAKSPVSVAPPGRRSDNLDPKVKLPGGGEAKPGITPGKGAGGSAAKGGAGGKAVGGGGPGGTVPTVDDLAKRFQALKR